MVIKGDTLIEVALAIGIFSMVAISVVTVMTGGTSSTQTALETTLAREEIDTQAEALRFIHAAYISDEEAGKDKSPYTQLWQEITNNAYTPVLDSDANKDFQQYSPSSCQDVYKNTNVLSKAFVINPRALSALSDTQPNNISNAINRVYISYQNNNNKFKQAATHPRLIYTKKATDNLTEENTGNNISSVEGLYVLAVKDPNGTIISPNGSSKKGSAYYDFYIRTCWYGTGSEMPTTISTVIRLYDPEGIKQK